MLWLACFAPEAMQTKAQNRPVRHRAGVNLQVWRVFELHNAIGAQGLGVDTVVMLSEGFSTAA
jgi:hypothetical protein